MIAIALFFCYATLPTEVFMSMPGPMEIVVVLLVVLLLFGTKRLPEIGKALGEGIREFKKSLKDASSDESNDKPKTG